MSAPKSNFKIKRLLLSKKFKNGKYKTKAFKKDMKEAWTRFNKDTSGGKPGGLATRRAWEADVFNSGKYKYFKGQNIEFKANGKPKGFKV